MKLCDHCHQPIERARRNQRYHPACRKARNAQRVREWRMEGKQARERVALEPEERDPVFAELDRLIEMGLGDVRGVRMREMAEGA